LTTTAAARHAAPVTDNTTNTPHARYALLLPTTQASKQHDCCSSILTDPYLLQIELMRETNMHCPAAANSAQLASASDYADHNTQASAQKPQYDKAHFTTTPPRPLSLSLLMPLRSSRLQRLLLLACLHTFRHRLTDPAVAATAAAATITPSATAAAGCACTHWAIA
jgi:hypothetical protein